MSVGFDPWVYAVPLPNGCQQMTEDSRLAASADYQFNKIDSTDYITVVNMVIYKETRCPTRMTTMMWLLAGGAIVGYILLKRKKGKGLF